MDWAHRVPLPMGFSRRESWSGLPFPTPGVLNPGIEPESLAPPALLGGFFTLCYLGSPKTLNYYVQNVISVHHDSDMGFPGGSEVEASACSAGDLGSIPGLGRYPGEENGNPLQYSCLEKPMNRGAWWDTVHGVTRSWTLSD